jgi:hypothetical protein
MHFPGLMDPLAYKSRVEHSAFVWDSKFNNRHDGRARFSTREDNIAVEEAKVFDISTPLTSQVVVERFLDYDCDGDRERYLYRNVQVESFLKGLNLDHLHRGTASDVRVPVVLFDDRHNFAPSATASTYQESSRRTLCAHEFYRSLRNSV